MANYTVKVNFNDGTQNYDLPYVQQVVDPKEAMKAIVVDGNRADGCIVIPGGKKSQDITVRGILWDNDGYKDLDTKINALKSAITTNTATLTLKYWDDTISGGGGWVNSWSYTVRRIEEIQFPSPSRRTATQDYEVRFRVLSF